MALWENDKLYLPSEFWYLYRKALEERELLEKCVAGHAGHGIHGGVSLEDTERHFTHRFPNSATRIEAIVVDPKSELETISTEIQATFSSGRVKVLDAPCGSGAGTLSLLTAVHSLREHKLLPSLALDVEIVAADISPHALAIFDQLLTNLVPIVARSGINLSWQGHQWDAQEVPQTSGICDEWLNEIGGGTEYVFLVANVSGVKKSGYKKYSEFPSLRY